MGTIYMWGCDLFGFVQLYGAGIHNGPPCGCPHGPCIWSEQITKINKIHSGLTQIETCFHNLVCIPLFPQDGGVVRASVSCALAACSRGCDDGRDSCIYVVWRLPPRGGHRIPVCQR